MSHRENKGDQRYYTERIKGIKDVAHTEVRESKMLHRENKGGSKMSHIENKGRDIPRKYFQVSKRS